MRAQACSPSVLKNMTEDKKTEQAVSDAITERPLKFKVGKRMFVVNPPTLGKMQVLSRYYLDLDIDDEMLGRKPQVESMRVCESKTDVVCRLMAVATFSKREDLLDEVKIEELADYFKWHCKPSDFSAVLLAILSQVHYENFISSIRLAATLRQNKPRKPDGTGRVE